MQTITDPPLEAEVTDPALTRSAFLFVKNIDGSILKY
jgi:hypothetical protein